MKFVLKGGKIKIKNIVTKLQEKPKHSKGSGMMMKQFHQASIILNQSFAHVGSSYP